MVVPEPKVSVTSSRPLGSKVKPKKVGNAGGVACFVTGFPTLPFLSIGNT